MAPDDRRKSDPAGAWYVAQTKPRQEQLAHEHLLRQGYGIYLPRLKVLRYMRGRPKIGFEPLFPRYLFFQPADANHSIAPVRSTLGVTSIVRFGGMPALVRRHTLEGVRAFEREQNAADWLELSDLQRGKSVVVNAGPLIGLRGLVEMVSKDRVIVLMRLLGEETRVTLAPGELRVAA
jgi:transcriptional antiterminator RfaH